ncbi:hypothetical protein F5I97DRAFT_1938607 [Phlebopus sp. FC_14]|nr:hypothetical protein F5I97DRAFT_1938607 [Phlebopus sp. FC_14]
MGPVVSLELPDEGPLDELQENTKAHASNASEDASGNKTNSGHEKQVKPNKVYVGGLPEHTRQEDLRNCFGKLGNIINIELKVGYGFVEFDNRDAAEESVAKYHEGYFMGNKIRVELSHNRGRAGKRFDDPGACFKCGENGHWARDCPRHNPQSRVQPYDPPLIDRMHPPRDYLPPPRDVINHRDDPGRYPAGGGRYYDDPSLPPPGRDYRRPLTPPRDYRDHTMDPPARSSRDYDDYRTRGPPSIPSRYDRPTDRDYSGSSRGYPPLIPRDSYDRHDRRPSVDDRYPAHASHGGRPRTPPGPPPLRRDHYDRPPRDYGRSDGRGRPLTPPRPADYYPRSSTPDGTRYRRRSLSPPPRSYDSGGYSGHSGNGYHGDKYSGQSRDGGRATRDYHSRNARGLEGSGYRRL